MSVSVYVCLGFNCGLEILCCQMSVRLVVCARAFARVSMCVSVFIGVSKLNTKSNPNPYSNPTNSNYYRVPAAVQNGT